MRRLALAATLVSVLFTAIPAAPASATASGGLVGNCTISFPSLPAAAGFGTCGNGLTPTTAVAHYSGLDTSGTPYAVAGAGNFRADFTYNSACITNEPIQIFTASGTYRAGNLSSTQGTASVAASFALTFVGATGIMLTSPATITFANGHTAVGAVGVGNLGTVTIAPLIAPTNVCPAGSPFSAPSVWTAGNPG